MLEVCVDTIEGAHAAVRAGAQRIELCYALSEGGLTPSIGLMQAAGRLPVPCYAMIRPRTGLFHFSMNEEQIMLADIDAARQCGLAGVVLGAQGDDGNLDVAMLERLSIAAGSLGRTLHRVIDVVPDQFSALETAIQLGFERVLTSGGKPTAFDGLSRIHQLFSHAGNRIAIMPGCGVTAENIDAVLATGVSEVHASCAEPVEGSVTEPNFSPSAGGRRTSETRVRQLIEAIDRMA